MSTKQAFWIVWNPQGRTPTKMHSTRDKAVREAERLARINKSERFIVLQSVEECVVDDVQRIRHEVAEFEKMPF